MDQNYLVHHGILGQKWGDRNGPPYPLNSSDHSAAEKKASKKYAKELKKIDRNYNSSIGGYKSPKKTKAALNDEHNKSATIIKEVMNSNSDMIKDAHKRYNDASLYRSLLDDHIYEKHIDAYNSGKSNDLKYSDKEKKQLARAQKEFAEALEGLDRIEESMSYQALEKMYLANSNKETKKVVDRLVTEYSNELYSDLAEKLDNYSYLDFKKAYESGAYDNKV